MHLVLHCHKNSVYVTVCYAIKLPLTIEIAEVTERDNDSDSDTI